MTGKRKKNIKFISLYNSFSPKEKIEFGNYLKNNTKISHRNYIRILTSLEINDGGIADIKGTDSSITRWNRFSELNLLAENFILHKSIDSENISKTGWLLKEYDKKDQFSTFRQKYTKLKTEISNKPIVNYDYNIVSQLDTIYLNHSKRTIKPLMFDKIFADTYNFRLGTFLFELLELMIEIKFRRSSKLLVSDFIAEEIFSGLNISKILTYLSGKEYSNNKLYQLLNFLYLMYLCITDFNDRQSYLNAKKIFFRDLKSISKEKRTDYYTFLINYNVELLNNSVPGAYRELFFLINKKLSEGLTADLTRKNLPLNQFRNYIIIGINLRKYSWVRNLIKNYGPILPSSVRDNDILIGTSLLMFAKKEYAACIELLLQIKKINPYHFVDVSVLKLKTLYELKKIVECHNELKKFKEYLEKDRIADDHLIIYSKEFLKAYSLLLKLNQNPTANNLNNLEFFLSKKNLIAKKWISEKTEELRIKN